MNLSRSNAGFSLVEVMVSILILGVALVGMTQGLTTALSSSKDAELETAAALVAAGQIELLRAEGLIRDGSTDGELSGALAGYRWRQTISKGAYDGLHEVSVVVESATSGIALFQLQTMLFEPPIDKTTEREKAASKAKSDKSKSRKGGRS
jgi:prepilin-type N-terminal cleavage/methylation domain-containing protein